MPNTLCSMLYAIFLLYLYSFTSQSILLQIKSQRLTFINCTSDILEQICLGDEYLADHLNIKIPDRWTEFGETPFRFVLDQLDQNPDHVNWWSWLPILTSENMLVGNCGFKGAPVNGVLEIGYEVAEAYRGNGIATEIAMALIDYAYTYPEVTTIIAHTLPFENHSVSVLRKCGFKYVAEISDPEDGLIWRWELRRLSSVVSRQSSVGRFDYFDKLRTSPLNDRGIFLMHSNILFYS